MRTDFFNLSDLLELNALDIYILPFETRWEDPKFDLKELNLTWYPQSYNSDLLQIKLNFTNFLYIS